jgi:hypothetical protein
MRRFEPDCRVRRLRSSFTIATLAGQTCAVSDKNRLFRALQAGAGPRKARRIKALALLAQLAGPHVSNMIINQ